MEEIRDFCKGCSWWNIRGTGVGDAFLESRDQRLSRDTKKVVQT